MVERSEIADLWHADKDDYGDCGGVFSEAHSHVFVEDWGPVVGCGEGDGDEKGADTAEDGVEEGGKRSIGMGTLEFLDTARVEVQQRPSVRIGSTAYALWK